MLFPYLVSGMYNVNSSDALLGGLFILCYRICRWTRKSTVLFVSTISFPSPVNIRKERENFVHSICNTPYRTDCVNSMLFPKGICLSHSTRNDSDCERHKWRYALCIILSVARCVLVTFLLVAAMFHGWLQWSDGRMWRKWLLLAS